MYYFSLAIGKREINLAYFQSTTGNGSPHYPWDFGYGTTLLLIKSSLLADVECYNYSKYYYYCNKLGTLNTLAAKTHHFK